MEVQLDMYQTLAASVLALRPAGASVTFTR